MNRESLEKELSDIAHYLGCNEGELISEVMNLLPLVLKELKPDIEEDYYKEQAQDLFGITI